MLTLLGAALLAGTGGCALLPKIAKQEGPKRHLLENPPPSPDLVGRLSFRSAKAEDTFVDLAPELGVGYVELTLANQHLDPWVPKAGERIVIPRVHLLPSGSREGIVVNTGDMRLYHFVPGERPRSYPIGIAKEGYATPHGNTKVVRKKENPIWYPSASALRDEPTLPRAVPPGPDNRLGAFALYLGWPTYLIHGTNDPRGVGRHSSRGCIRLYPEHIEELFARVPVGTKVRVVHEPVKTGWVGGELYLEVHPDKDRALALDESGKLEREPVRDLRDVVTKAAGKELPRVDWTRVERVSLLSAGIPVRITGRDELSSRARSATPERATPRSAAR
ncbi:L,D-transpeptidase family protein [Myxococcota bacterium]|nr:L,D-transpeptidase family protein [Myxococcota bacterium]